MMTEYEMLIRQHSNAMKIYLDRLDEQGSLSPEDRVSLRFHARMLLDHLIGQQGERLANETEIFLDLL